MRILMGLLALALAGCHTPTAAEIERADAAAIAEMEAWMATPEVLVARQIVRPYPRAASVRLFVESGRDAEGRGVFVEPQGRILSAEQRGAIEGTITTGSYTGMNAVAACFVPHHFLRYYDSRDKQIGEVAICFCCQGIQGDPDITGRVASGADYARLEYDREALKAIIEGMGLRTDFECHDEG